LTLARTLKEESARRWVGLIVAVVVVRLALTVLAWGTGLVLASDDGPTRSLYAWELSHDFLHLPQRFWLPLHFFTSAIGMKATGDIYRGVVMTNVLVSIAALVVLCAVARLAFGRTAAAVAGLLAAATPWGVWLGASQLASPLLQLTVLSAVYAFLRWLKTGTRSWIIVAAACLAAGNMTREESWCFSAILSIGVFVAVLRGQLNWLLGGAFWCIVWAPPAAWCLAGASEHGGVAFLAAARVGDYLASFSGEPVWSRIARYPAYFLAAAPMLALLAFACVLVKWRRMGRLAGWVAILCFGELALFSVGALVGATPSAIPVRVVHLNTLLACVLVGGLLVGRGFRRVSLRGLMAVALLVSLQVSRVPAHASVLQSGKYDGLVNAVRSLRTGVEGGLLPRDLNVIVEHDSARYAYTARNAAVLSGQPGRVLDDALPLSSARAAGKADAPGMRPARRGHWYIAGQEHRSVFSLPVADLQPWLEAVGRPALIRRQGRYPDIEGYIRATGGSGWELLLHADEELVETMSGRGRSRPRELRTTRRIADGVAVGDLRTEGPIFAHAAYVQVAGRPAAISEHSFVLELTGLDTKRRFRVRGVFAPGVLEMSDLARGLSAEVFFDLDAAGLEGPAYYTAEFVGDESVRLGGFWYAASKREAALALVRGELRSWRLAWALLFSFLW